jgi:hypothetical protein
MLLYDERIQTLSYSFWADLGPLAAFIPEKRLGLGAVIGGTGAA